MPVLALASLLVAMAQEPQPAPPEGPVAAPQPAAPIVAEPLGERFVWEQRARLPGGVGADSVVVTGTGDWIVMATDGSVLRSSDKGSTWARVLAGRDDEAGPGDEEILLEAEAVREEEIGTVEADVEVEVDADSLEVETTYDASEAEEQVEDVREEVVARLQEGAEVEAAPGVVWIDPADPALALAGRADGIWRSEDGGHDWRRAMGDSASAFASFRGLVVAGTQRGVAYSVDRGETWIDVEGAAGGRAVGQLAVVGTWLYAAGETGLWKSADGLRWEAVPGLGVARVVAITPDPAWPGGFWVASPSGLLRTDDDGASFHPSGRQPWQDLRGLVHLGATGHLLAVSGDGVWESIDGGLRWTPASRLLTDPDVRGVAFDGGLPVIATRTGVWRMIAPMAVERTAGRDAQLPLYDSVRAAQSRRGLDVEPLSLARAGTLSYFAPRLSVQFDWDRWAMRDTQFVEPSPGTIEDYDSNWQILARLCWGACGEAVEIDTDAGTVDEAWFEEDLFVMDGEVFTDDQVVTAAANVAQNIRKYNNHLAQVVTDAWIARRRLAADDAQLASLPLAAQVDRALQIMELDARLDAYTQGAWLGSLQTSQEVR